MTPHAHAVAVSDSKRQPTAKRLSFQRVAHYDVYEEFKTSDGMRGTFYHATTPNLMQAVSIAGQITPMYCDNIVIECTIMSRWRKHVYSVVTLDRWRDLKCLCTETPSP